MKNAKRRVRGRDRLASIHTEIFKECGEVHFTRSREPVGKLLLQLTGISISVHYEYCRLFLL